MVPIKCWERKTEKLRREGGREGGRERISGGKTSRSKKRENDKKQRGESY